MTYYAAIAVTIKNQQIWSKQNIDAGEVLYVHSVHEQVKFKNKTNLKYHNADHRTQERPRADVIHHGMEWKLKLL